METILVAVLAVIALGVRDWFLYLERKESARERAELLNRITHNAMPYVPPVVKPLPGPPADPPDLPESDPWEHVGAIVGSDEAES